MLLKRKNCSKNFSEPNRSLLLSNSQLTTALCTPRSHSKPDAGDVKRISQLAKSIEGFEKELEKLRTKASGYEERINKLQAQIEEVGGLKLKSQKAKVSDLQDQIRHNEDRYVKAKTGKAKAEKDLAKLLKNLETNTAKLEETQAELAELVEQLEANTAEMDPIRETVESIREALSDKREELQTLKSELDEQEGAIIEFKKLEVSRSLQSLVCSRLLLVSLRHRRNFERHLMIMRSNSRR